MRRRHLMLANIGFRIAYGVGGVCSPSGMARLQVAPDTSEQPEARLFVRGFSAHQIGVALLGIAGLHWHRFQRPAALAAAAIDIADMFAAAVETGERRRLDGDLAGGLVFSAAGVATAAAALSAAE